MSVKLLSSEEIKNVVESNKGWKNENQSFTKTFSFTDFNEAVNFVNRVAIVAEELDHHPDIFISYSKVKLTVSTHSKGGLTHLDSELVKEVEAIRK